MSSFVIASNKSFHRDLFDRLRNEIPGNWHFVSETAELDPAKLELIRPEYIFFLHWSEKISREVYETFNCVVFHMTDLPYGRGGSPLQNLIVRGHTETKLSAIKVVEALDAGDVYMKADLSLEGTARDILRRAAEKMKDMISEIILRKTVPVPQQGTPVIFKRRKPEDSNMKELQDTKQVYDHIRMLDAEGYPHAFIENEHFRFEFTNAQQQADHTLSAHVRIIKK